MKVLKSLRNYFLYCGIEKEEYDAIKKDVYVSNFSIWRILHFFMASVFLALFISSLMSKMLRVNSFFYLMAFLYSAAGIAYFFLLKRDSKIAKLLMYLSMSLLFLFGCFISRNNAYVPATTFIALLLIAPMFVIDRPIYMTVELYFLSLRESVPLPLLFLMLMLKDVASGTSAGVSWAASCSRIAVW